MQSYFSLCMILKKESIFFFQKTKNQNADPQCDSACMFCPDKKTVTVFSQLLQPLHCVWIQRK